MKKVLLCVVMALAALAAIPPSAYAEPQVGDRAPDFTVANIAGGQYTLSDNFKSPAKVVLLDIWATWCGPCKNEIPYLIQLYNKYQDRGLEACGVAIDTTVAPVQDYVSSAGIPYTICHDSNAAIVGQPYNVESIPRTYIIDKTGIIRWLSVGFSSSEVSEMDQVIDELLGQQSSVKVTSISPSSAPNTGSVDITEIAGEGFQDGATVKLTRTSQPDITATDVSVVSATKITCKFSLSGKAAGKWNVVVTNTDDQSGALEEGFTISEGVLPPPTISSITPNSGLDSALLSITAITGTGFRSGASVRLMKDGQPDVVATNVNVANATSISCTLDLTAKASGEWNVVVINPDSQFAILANAFTVNAAPVPPPTVVSITPNFGVNNGSVNIENLAGTNFRSGTTVKLTKTGEADILATSVTAVSSTRITCVFGLTGKTPGQWNVVVTNPDTNTCTLTNGFRINAAPDPPPTVASITPNTGGNAGSFSITNLAGTGFKNGATVKLVKIGQSDIAATNVVVVSATKITCVFGLVGKATGDWDVRVTNSDSQYGTLSKGFSIVTVTSPAPTVTAVTPNSGVNNGPVSITNLAGTGFAEGAAVKLTKTGQADIIASDVVVVSSTRITCQLDLTGEAVGTWSVVVTNADGQSGALANGFTIEAYVAPPPAVTSITPESGANDGEVSITELAGTGFQSGAIVRLTRSGEADIVATDVVVESDTKITCRFDLTSVPVGMRSVEVENGDGQTGSLADCFAVSEPALPAPVVTGVTPNSRANTGFIGTTSIVGAAFQSGATAKLTKSGQPDIEATNVEVASSTEIICAFDLFGVSTGKWDLTVTNPDGQSGTLSEAITVLAAPVQPPIVGSITPGSGLNIGRVEVTSLTGSGFQAGAVVKLARADQPDITATDVVVVDSETITCKVDIAGKAVGKWDVVVRNPDGQTGGLADAFTVGEKLRVTSITPNSVANTGEVSVTNLAGSGFRPGVTVRLTRTGQIDIWATGLSVDSSTKITCKLDVTRAASGRWNVIVESPDGQSATLSDAFQIGDFPTVAITKPVSSGSCTRNYWYLDIAGAASDAEGILRVTWATDHGASGICTGTDEWTAQGIPLVTGDNVITVTAIDDSGRSATDTLTVTYVNALPGDAWQKLAMVSLPIIPDETDPKPVVGFQDSSWCMYLTSAKSYISYGADPEHYTWFEPTDQTPGRGFWARFGGSTPKPYGTIPSQDREVSIPLRLGWNLVGQPFIAPIAWDTTKIMVLVDGVRRPLNDCGGAVLQYAWGWDPDAGAYYMVCDKCIIADGVDTLAPWQAYWFIAKRECSLILKAE